MKAVLLDKPGPPSSLRIGEISTPRPGADEALVRVCATSLNPVDYRVAAQGYERWRYPHVLGVDVAGVIETMGEGVISWNRGDKAFYHTTWRKDGSYAEFNVAPAHTFARITEGVSFVDAATLPCAALTAYCALPSPSYSREGYCASTCGCGRCWRFCHSVGESSKGVCDWHLFRFERGVCEGVGCRRGN
jgi:NADPH2:quinone reductase